MRNNERILSIIDAKKELSMINLDSPLREARDLLKEFTCYQLAKLQGSMTRLAERSGLERTHSTKNTTVRDGTPEGVLEKEQSIMKILILGAGRVGSSLAEMLVSDDKSDVTVVDTHTEALDNLQERFDLRTVAGTATSIDVQRCWNRGC